MGYVFVGIVLFLVGLSLEREIKKALDEMQNLNKKFDYLFRSYDRSLDIIQKQLEELKELVGE